MATWEDGPEYAPRARPDTFLPVTPTPVDPPSATPPVDPPPTTPPPPSEPPSIVPERPTFTGPDAPTPPLTDLAPTRGPQRDPSVPFEVASSTATAGPSWGESAWAAAHWSRPAGPAASAPWPAPGYGAGSANPWPSEGPAATWPSTGPAPTWPPPPPTAYPGGNGAPAAQSWPATPPLVPSSGPPTSINGYPAPGSPQWFAPPGPPTPAATTRLTAGQVLNTVTPGVALALGIGGIIVTLAPVTFTIATVLSGRIPVARETIRKIFRIPAALLAFVGLVVALGGDSTFSEWWSGLARWAAIISWAVLIATVIVVARALKPPAPPPPPSYPWR